MNTFDDRKKTFEKKFANEQELQFKVDARRNKYLGEWAGKILGKKENEIIEYIQEIIKSDFEEPGHEDVLRKIKKDFSSASINIEDSEIREEIERALSRAKNDFK